MRILIVAATVALACCTARIPGITPAPAPLRILVFNIHAGKDAAGKPNLDAVAALVKSTGAQIVLLQEVDRGTARSGRVDQVAALAEATKYDTAFGASLLHYDGGEYGIAALSRTGIGFHSTVPLAVTPVPTRAGGSREPRVALVVMTVRRGGVWRAIDTHLDPSDESARAQEIADLVGIFREQAASKTPLVVGGDFNSTPDNPVLAPLREAGLRDAWTECGSGDGFTYPADKPIKRIDYLFLSAEVHCTGARVVDTQASDHRPLLVTIR